MAYGLSFDEYQTAARRTQTGRWTPERAALGLCEEAGEVAGKLKRVARGDMSEQEAEALLIDELGDVLWYASALADNIGISLDAVANKNIAKLASRQERGVIKGEGDDR